MKQKDIQKAMEFVDILTTKTSKYKIGDLIITYNSDIFIVGIAGHYMWKGKKHYMVRMNMDRIAPVSRCEHQDCRESLDMESAETLYMLIYKYLESCDSKPKMKKKKDVFELLYNAHNIPFKKVAGRDWKGILDRIDTKSPHVKINGLAIFKATFSSEERGKFGDLVKNFMSQFDIELSDDDGLPDFDDMTNEEVMDWMNDEEDDGFYDFSSADDEDNEYMEDNGEE